VHGLDWSGSGWGQLAGSFVCGDVGKFLISCSDRTLLSGDLNTAAEDMLMAVRHENICFIVLII
jgi:hypothetical protein